MISAGILTYLISNDVRFELIDHPQAISAQRLAQSMHVSGYEVAKSVVVDADGQQLIAVLPAPAEVDTLRLAWMLGAWHAELCDEETLQGMFPDCELGAEPPFGGLYGLPVVLDASLQNAPFLVMRAGSHTQALRMPLEDFLELERPQICSFALRPGHGWTEAWASLL